MLDREPWRATEPHRYPSPIAPRRALAMLEMLELAPKARVLDASYGDPGLLLDAIALHDCSGTILCPTAADAARVRELAERERVDARLEILVHGRAEHAPSARYDAMLLVGARLTPEALGEATSRCIDWLRMGGRLLFGAPFLRRAPASDYRHLLGDDAEHLRPGGVYARSVVGSGFELMATAVCSESEWDAYESAAYRARVRYAAEHPEAPDVDALRERAEAWYQAYWKYGRDTLGYAFHLFRRPRAVLKAVPPA